MEHCLFSPLWFLFFFFIIIHFQFFHLAKCSDTPLCQSGERWALLQLKKSFSTIPTNPFNSSLCKGDAITGSWNETADCCTWEGITCHEASGHVIGLELSCSMLQGVITSNNTLFHLRHLQRLDLSYNDFGGSSIVPQFGQFKSLTHLDLSSSWFSGNVPVEISHLSSLVSLKIEEFRERRITIEADTFKALARNATKISQIQLSGVDMSSVPIIHLLNLSSSLTILKISSCLLYGKLFGNAFDFPNLSVLDLSDNNLDGPISTSNFNLEKLTQLDLSFNYFIGNNSEDHDDFAYNFSLHNSSTYLPSLTYLSLSSNLINGTIPSWIYALPSLEMLDLSENLLIGKIDDFRSMSLNALFLALNNLQGIIPRSIFRLVELEDLDLSSNNLTDNVEIEALSNNLVHLDLSFNHLALSFNNSTRFSLEKLSTLKLSSCNLKEFPHFLANSKELDTLDLSKNQLKGNVPKWLLEASKDSLYTLNLSHNFLTYIDLLPMYNLHVLDLSSNLFSGPLSIPSSNFMWLLLLPKNKFEGEIPKTICEMTFLEVLDFSDNSLSGTIPQCIWNFSQRLSVVDIQRNRLRGTIPTIFVKENRLRSINLNGNQIEGQVPRSLAHCTNLEVLDLGNNSLTDTFPHWLESLPQLHVLVLRSNRFCGSIPNPIAKFPFHELRIMDLSHNEFSGSLPTKNLENFDAMKKITDAQNNQVAYIGEAYYQDSVMVTMKGLDIELVKVLKIFTTIDFSSNNFAGEIPEFIGNLKSLKGLNFSNNMISGTIPSSLANLSNLEWLDLSSNELEGKIPMEFVDITTLAFLNLSQNCLEGPIPRGNQFNTFDNNSFMGNQDLCGFPLSKPCGHDTNVKLSSPPTLEQDYHSSITGGFSWKIVMMGFGSGFVIGISIGYMVLYSNGKLSWLCEKTLEDKRHKKVPRPKGQSMTCKSSTR